MFWKIRYTWGERSISEEEGWTPGSVWTQRLENSLPTQESNTTSHVIKPMASLIYRVSNRVRKASWWSPSIIATKLNRIRWAVLAEHMVEIKMYIPNTILDEKSKERWLLERQRHTWENITKRMVKKRVWRIGHDWFRVNFRGFCGLLLYLTMLSVPENTSCRMMGWSVNNHLEVVWNWAVIT